MSVAANSGLHYRWTISARRPLDILGSIGNGCAFLDYDNSGNLSILLVGKRVVLYKGDGGGHFVDVGKSMGLDRLNGHFLGCAVGDYDNDGYDDIYLTGYHTGVLLHNEHGRSFKDVTASCGLKPQEWGTSAAFVDVDGDGDLDLYVADYVQYGPHDQVYCTERGVSVACGPHYYRTAHGVLYHNLGGKSFEDVTNRWSVQQAGNGLGIAVADFEGDGRPGFAVANDLVMTDLFQYGRQFGAPKLSNIGVPSGVFADRSGQMHGAMGIDWGDYDNDGRPDLFVTTYADETKCLYHNDGRGLFSERAALLGIANPTRPYLSFGCKFLDADNDGWLDILIASGHLFDNVAKIDSHKTYRQPTIFLHNRGPTPGGFDDASRVAGVAALPSIVGRGLAVGDFDNDGRIDALVVDAEGAPLLLHNETQTNNHWIGVSLQGSGHSNRDGYGAVVTATLTDGHTLTRECEPSGSYMSSSDKRVLIGLGSANVKSATVRWPDGKVETKTDVAVDRYADWVEGALK